MICLPLSLSPIKQFKVVFKCSCGWKGSKKDLVSVVEHVANFKCCPKCSSHDVPMLSGQI